MLVMKFGGKSVATAQDFHRIAGLIGEKGEESVVVVVSAMGNTTDHLMALAKEVHPEPPVRELDMLVSVGERMSVALLAMALALRGREAVSFTGSQSGIMTSDRHTDARIIDVRPARILAALCNGQIAVVAGFQGVSEKGEITTLGRGGSDTTAVALAIALGASRVEFYKDVSGIYTRDPKEDSSAMLLPLLNYGEALDLAQRGAKVLHPRSIALAEKNRIALWVRSFSDATSSGTWIRSEGERQQEGKIYEMVG